MASRLTARLARTLLTGAPMLLVAASAHAQAQTNLFDTLIPADGTSVSGRIVQLVVVLTILSVAPGLLIMVTSFTRFVIALSFLRSGLGMQSTPANLVLISLSLFMTFYVMSPTFDRAWQDGVQPLLNNQISEQDAYTKITDPFRTFMAGQVRPKDLKLFEDLDATRIHGAADAAPGSAPSLAAVAPGAAAMAAEEALPPDKVDLRVLIPAFMVSELRRAFEIGFLIVLPFLIIDIVVGTLVMSMGMMMMPPAILALPFKILFFVLIDGWNLLVGGLVQSYF